MVFLISIVFLKVPTRYCHHGFQPLTRCDMHQGPLCLPACSVGYVLTWSVSTMSELCFLCFCVLWLSQLRLIPGFCYWFPFVWHLWWSPAVLSHPFFSFFSASILCYIVQEYCLSQSRTPDQHSFG